MNSSHEEDSKREIENSPEEEGVLAAGADAVSEAKAADCVVAVFDEPSFGRGWTAEAYNAEYYSPLSAEDMRSAPIIRQAERQEGWKSVIDIREVKRLVSEARTESLENIAMTQFRLGSLPAIFKVYPDDHLSVLDVGAGSNAANDIELMVVADSITHSEYLAENREEMRKWKAGKSGFECASFIMHFREYAQAHPELFKAASPAVKDRIGELLGKDAREMEAVLREKIRDIIPVDVFRKDLGFGAEDDAGFDMVNISKWGGAQLVTSNFCVESATASMEKWRQGMDNIAEKVAPGGFLLMNIIRNANWYKVGEGRESAVPINAELLRDELTVRGFDIERMTELIGSDKEVVGYDGMVFALARKKEVVAQ